MLREDASTRRHNNDFIYVEGETTIHHFGLLMPLTQKGGSYGAGGAGGSSMPGGVGLLLHEQGEEEEVCNTGDP